MWIIFNNISLGVWDKGFRMSVGKASFMSSRPSLPNLSSCAQSYNAHQSKRVEFFQILVDRLAVRIERWLRVKLRRFQADSSHKSLYGRFGLPDETEEVSAT